MDAMDDDAVSIVDGDDIAGLPSSIIMMPSSNSPIKRSSSIPDRSKSSPSISSMHVVILRLEILPLVQVRSSLPLVSRRLSL